MARKKLGEMLVEAGVLDEASVRAALGEQKRWGGTLGRALVEMRLIDENTWATFVSEKGGLVASHYPLLLDTDAEDLAALTHFAKPDDELQPLSDEHDD